MIYVRRDSALIPERIIKVAERAQKQLELLPLSERSAFIKKNSHILRGFARYLSKMSYGKCWYSESPEAQSFFDVDHYRPKSEAIRGDGQKDDGYSWLAFSWENFRFAAQRSNRHSKDEDTDLVRGKGSWFPLLDDSPRACWDDRCIDREKPVLLDPTVRRDVDLIEIDPSGYVCESRLCIGSAKLRVERSIELYGLNLPRLVAARKKVMREISDLHLTLQDMLAAAGEHPPVADSFRVDRQVEQIRRSTLPNSPYSKAARAQARYLGIEYLCGQPEDVPAVCNED